MQHAVVMLAAALGRRRCAAVVSVLHARLVLLLPFAASGLFQVHPWCLQALRLSCEAQSKGASFGCVSHETSASTVIASLQPSMLLYVLSA